VLHDATLVLGAQYVIWLTGKALAVA
jgi:hypothetical protein